MSSTAEIIPLFESSSPAYKIQSLRAAASLHNPDSVSTVRITVDQYLRETTPTDRHHIRREVVDALRTLLLEGSAVYLHTLGILFTQSESSIETKSFTDKVAHFENIHQIILFERCSELRGDHYQNHKVIAGPGEIASRVTPQLQLFTGWSAPQCRRYIRGFLKLLSEELATGGWSNLLEPIGTLYAQRSAGVSTMDRLAGADIFLKAIPLRTIRSTPLEVTKQSTFQNAWEPLERLYGPSICEGSLQLLPELIAMGYSRQVLLKEIGAEHLMISWKAFQHTESEQSSLILCTNSLRDIAFRNGRAHGCEYIIQILFSELAMPIEQLMENNPFIAKSLTVGWILMQSHKSNCPEAGDAMGIEGNLNNSIRTIRRGQSPFNTVCTTTFQPCPNPQRTDQGSFSYLSLLGLYASEAEFGKRHCEQLFAHLERRGYAQRFRLSRPCLTL